MRFTSSAGRRPASMRLGAAVAAVAATLALAPAALAAPRPSAAIPIELQPVQTVAVHLGTQVVDRGTMAAKARAHGASARSLAVIEAATSCWSDGGYVYQTNILGQKLWQYNESHDWCGSGGYITYVYPSTHASNMMIGWAYKGDTKSSQWGVGWNVWKETLSGHFCLVEYFGCIQNSYPWIQYEVGGGGQEYFWNWDL